MQIFTRDGRGTISGVSNALKEKNKNIKIYLSDPKGSALYNYIKNGELKSVGGSITEGIGSSRVTKNFENAKIDDAYSIDDHEALPILFDLIQNEGLSLGTSCGINIAGAIRMGKELGPGKTIVTILCDKSDKYSSKMFNKKFLEEKGLPFPSCKVDSNYILLLVIILFNAPLSHPSGAVVGSVLTQNYLHACEEVQVYQGRY